MKKTKLRSNAFLRGVPVRETSRQESTIDLWLQRLSHLSQVGIFAFTVGTIYFTVIPLYQKSLLDEAIAKKEVELKQANQALRSVYEKARPFIAKDFAHGLSSSCSPFGQQANEKRNGMREDLDVERLFDYEVLSCIKRNIAEAKNIGQLSLADRAALTNKAIAAGEAIEQMRRDGLSRFQSAESRAKTEPESLPPPGKFTQQYLDFASKFKTPQKVEEVRMASRIKEERARVALEYQSQAQRLILSTQKLEWPNQ